MNARKSRGFSQDEIAEKLSVKRSSYAEWEKETVPRADIFYRFAGIVGYSPDDLLKEGWSPDEKSAKPLPKNATSPNEETTTKEILKIIAEGYRAQVETIRNMENKMAQESTQKELKEKVQAMESRTERIENALGEMEDKTSVASNLNFVVATVMKLSKIQDEGIENLRKDISQIMPLQNISDRDVRKNKGQSDGDGKKRDRHRPPGKGK